MEFIWDKEKNRQNIVKHGLDFIQASKVFDGTLFSKPSHGDDEVRTMSVGRIENFTIAVIHTERDGKCRIISARPASRKERDEYEKALQKTADTGGTEGDSR